ncbi:hypothetical protein ABT009_08935 [Streptomyces sp. NPDC002896]|uniref:hypothetical protein n=1 Tax=Streptomyces sp. NPDC002896 TaxID=3154438 RepID=UPI00332A3489
MFGHAEIEAFRRSRSPQGLDRTLGRTEIVTRNSIRQCLPEGWRVVGAHASRRL